MSKNIITTKDLYNVRVMGGKNGTKRIGKVRSFVFHPKERRLIGFMVKRPDLLWMFHRKDLFVSLDGFELEDGRVVLADDSKTRDKAACKALDVRLDDCVIWVGLPVVTESGSTLGTVGTVTFSLVSGKVESFVVNTGATANALLGTRSVPGELIRGFRRGIGAELANQYEGDDETPVLGAILVADAAEEIPVEGGAAEKAGAATAVAVDKAHTAVDKVKPKVSEAAHVAGEAVNKGAYATGKQIGAATGMFSEFKKEYDKARGPVPGKGDAAEASEGDSTDATAPDAAQVEAAAGSETLHAKPASQAAKKAPVKKAASAKKAPAKKETSTGEDIGRAVGKQLKAAGGMFSAFKEEYNKARHDD